MSKKKNTLKDLDEFLKQQAATLVSPARISDQSEPKVSPGETERITDVPQAPGHETGEQVSTEKVSHDLQQLFKTGGARFREQFYDLIIKTVESRNQYSGEDRVLINTALYLKSGDQWKEVIRNYWRGKNK